ncbi:hypothetical protein BC830DRAFT_1134405 [Chytriomyces sp. MP71]|nr:hypothetical protein BC830DRAFT_1134405 [Chytriomyces sp. MP71]
MKEINITSTPFAFLAGATAFHTLAPLPSSRRDASAPAQSTPSSEETAPSGPHSCSPCHQYPNRGPPFPALSLDQTRSDIYVRCCSAQKTPTRIDATNGCASYVHVGIRSLNWVVNQVNRRI